MSYAEDLLTQCLTVQGTPEAEARKIVRRILEVGVEVEIFPVATIDRWEMSARIYHLRGSRMIASVIAARMGCTERMVFKAIRQHRGRMLRFMRLAS